MKGAHNFHAMKKGGYRSSYRSVRLGLESCMDMHASRSPAIRTVSVPVVQDAYNLGTVFYND